jgi:predicted phosphodiesterase
VPYLNITDAARRLGIARSTLRDRIARDPDRYRTDALGRMWFDDIEAVPPQNDYGASKTLTPAPSASVPLTPRPIDLDALPPATPRRPVSSAIEAQRIPSAPHVDRLEKWILIPDCHVPYHSREAVGLMLRAAQAIGATNAVILGDFADFWAVSSHPKSPERRADLQWEVDEVNKALDMLQHTFTGQVKYIAGNHENRLERYLGAQAPALYSSMKVESLFRIKDRGWTFTQYKDHTSIGKLHLTHDCGKAGKNAHVDAMNAFQSNVIIGHTHRLAYAVEGNAQGKPHVGAMLGWLGDPAAVEYMFKVRAARDWAHGFGVAYVEPDGCVHVVPVPIVNGRVCVEGRLVR